jgi:hypothetical protein
MMKDNHADASTMLFSSSTRMTDVACPCPNGQAGIRSGGHFNQQAGKGENFLPVSDTQVPYLHFNTFIYR